MTRSRRTFLSYRRDDCQVHAGRLAENLRYRVGDEVFLDSDTIALGENFAKRIEREIGSCDVVLVMIGDDWLTIADGDGRPRLLDPRDWIFLEIKAALERDIPVVPVLVEGASMPRPEQLPDGLQELAFRNGAELRDGNWAADFGRLAASLPAPAAAALPDVTEAPGRSPAEPWVRARLDFVAAHAFVESVPEGRWTSYKEVARAAGAPRGAMAIGGWLLRGAPTRNAWRVLTSRGTVSEGWAPSSDDQPATADDVRDRLRAEGIQLDSRGRADPRRQWRAEDAGEVGAALAGEADATSARGSSSDPAAYPSRITTRFLKQEVSRMGHDKLRALVAELRRRRWTDEEIDERVLGFSALRPPTRLPDRITASWLANNVPLLSASRIRELTAVLRQRGWSSDEIRTHVLAHREGEGLAEEIPASIKVGWLERNAPLMTAAEQSRVAEVMFKRGWSTEEVEHYLPYALQRRRSLGPPSVAP